MEPVIGDILRREGGFVNHPADRGGPTKYGITASTLETWRKLGRPATVEDVQNMTEAEARDIYASLYVAGPGFDKLPDGALKDLLVDSAVLHGTGRALAWLRKALGSGSGNAPVTNEEAKLLQDQAVRADVYRSVLADRARLFGAILKKPAQSVFAVGWLNRLAEFIEKEVS